MPYSYLLFRAKRPLQVGARADEPDVAPIGTFEEIKARFRAALPELTWNNDERSGYYKVGDEEFLVHLFEQGPIHDAVSATGYTPRGFQQYLVKVCDAAGLFAVDDGVILGGKLGP